MGYSRRLPSFVISGHHWWFPPGLRVQLCRGLPAPSWRHGVFYCAHRWKRVRHVWSLGMLGYHGGTVLGCSDASYQAASLNKFIANINGRKRLTFIDTHSSTFPTVDEAEHEQKPDIVFLKPADGSSWHMDIGLQQGQYERCTGVVEAKSRKGQDPIDPVTGKTRDNSDARATIVQIAKNARSLLMANMSCFVFIIGIYGHSARIYRFDRAGVIVSPSFNYVADPIIFGKVFFRLVHPAPTTGIVGADYAIKFWKNTPCPLNFTSTWNSTMTTPCVKYIILTGSM